MELPVAQSLTVIGLLLTAILAFYSERIMTGKAHRRQMADKDDEIKSLKSTVNQLLAIGMKQAKIFEMIAGTAEDKRP